LFKNGLQNIFTDYANSRPKTYGIMSGQIFRKGEAAHGLRSSNLEDVALFLGNQCCHQTRTRPKRGPARQDCSAHLSSATSHHQYLPKITFVRKPVELAMKVRNIFFPQVKIRTVKVLVF